MESSPRDKEDYRWLVVQLFQPGNRREQITFQIRWLALWLEELINIAVSNLHSIFHRVKKPLTI